MHLILALSLAALADVGPAPECPAGTHSQYLYGRHCVKDGFQLVAKEGGGVEEVPVTPQPSDAPTPDPAAPIAETPPVTPIPEAPAAEAPAAEAPAAEARCAAAPGGGLFPALLALGLLARRRTPRA